MIGLACVLLGRKLKLCYNLDNNTTMTNSSTTLKRRAKSLITYFYNFFVYFLFYFCVMCLVSWSFFLIFYFYPGLRIAFFSELQRKGNVTVVMLATLCDAARTRAYLVCIKTRQFVPAYWAWRVVDWVRNLPHFCYKFFSVLGSFFIFGLYKPPPFYFEIDN